MINNEHYEEIFERPVEDLKSAACLLRHKKSGARIFILSNTDDNKVFYIAFRTPPEDSTGAAHIMEHSVLCGSEKFPLKDPFVELAKGSLNTFLNAMTYPDKTVYPVASRNDRDFRNLQDVYLDAVFHPNVYKHPEIMRQEGWNLRLDDPAGPIEYNGVVYNEMKGAFSSPEEVLARQTMNALFPDTAYGVESGGDPERIPDLTYENFLDFHRKYYHPSNSYIYLYGNMDVAEQLEWLDSEYLGKYDKISVESDIKRQEPFDSVREIRESYPITDDESEEGNTYLTYGAVCGTCHNVKLSFAMQMISYALVDTQGAPIRESLLEAGIGRDIMSMYDGSLLQPYFTITAKGANEDQKDEFLRIIRAEFKQAAEAGIDRKSLLASLNSLKFKYREADFGGYPKGLVYGLTCLDSWLYDDGAPLSYIELNDIFGELEEELDSDYYERAVRMMLLGNTHAALVVLAPEKGLAARREEETAARLSKLKASLTEEEINALAEQTRALEAYQKEPPSPEALLTIPLLDRSDLDRTPREVRNNLSEAAGIPVLEHDYDTNGIAYINILFDLNDTEAELFPYLGLLKSIVSFVDTENYSYSELNNEINTYTGALGMDVGVYSNVKDKKKNSVIADLSVRVLYENIGKAFDLAEEVLFTGKYRDSKRMREITAELFCKLQAALMSSGHVAAAGRASSYFSENAMLKEQINGIEFYKFAERLEKNFGAEKDRLFDAVEKIMKMIARPGKIFVNCTASAEGIALVKERLKSFASALAEKAGAAEEEMRQDSRTRAEWKTASEKAGAAEEEMRQDSRTRAEWKTASEKAGAAEEEAAAEKDEPRDEELRDEEPRDEEPRDEEPRDEEPWDPRTGAYDFDGKGFSLKRENEAFVTSGSVNYVARAGRFAEGIDEFTGAERVFDTIMRYEYLWSNIRVLGGAYGCSCLCGTNGEMRLATFRDPNIAGSNDVFEKIPEYLEKFDCDEREMTKYVIGTISAMDMPLTPAQKGAADFSAYFAGDDEAARRRIREQVIDCAPCDIRALSPKIRAALDQGNICCVGTERGIEEDRDLFENVRNLFE